MSGAQAPRELPTPEHAARARTAAAIGAELAGAGFAAPEGVPRLIERSAYNLALRKAADKGVHRSWQCRRFASQYEQCAVYCVRNAVQMAAAVAAAAASGASAADVAATSSQSLRPDVWKALVDEKKARDSETNKGCTLKANTSAFRCGRCKSRECYFYELQTRSADEPMSVFLTCLDCGHRWRIG